MNRYYIGLATSVHDPSIAIVDDAGTIVFAEDAERYLQNKRAWCSPPDDFIRINELLKRYCEPGARFVLATSWRQKFSKKLQSLAFGPCRGRLRRKIGPETYDLLSCMAAYTNLRHGINTEASIRKVFGPQSVTRYEYEHHLTHSAAACLSSTFEDALSVVVDGLGEWTSSNVYHYSRGTHRLLSRQRSTVSLGRFYSVLCRLCGFDPLAGEEWKVMGLAAYGRKDDRYYALLRDFLVVDGITLRRGKQSASSQKKLWAERRTPAQPALDCADLAYTGQLVFAEYMDELLRNVHACGLSDNLVLSGGCALNSAYVGRIGSSTPFKRSFVFCAPADNGNAVGAALLAFREDHPEWTPRALVQTPYLGSTVEPQAVERLLRYGGLELLATRTKEDIYSRVAAEIASGKIVGWVQGRAEFGPRALGNRSILADPRNRKIKEIINAKVKFREEFRPFAPSILAEFGDTYFENYCDTPYMERALKFRPGMTQAVPGVVHVDGTGRLHSVTRELNEDFYLLLEAFHRITGVPLLLNTSFNVMGKPIVHSVEDAVAVFLTSGIDLLVIGGYIFAKPTGAVHSAQDITHAINA